MTADRAPFTERERKAIMDECARRGIPEAAALDFMARAGNAVLNVYGIAPHCWKKTPATAQRKALQKLADALALVESMPEARKALGTAFRDRRERMEAAGWETLAVQYPPDTGIPPEPAEAWMLTRELRAALADAAPGDRKNHARRDFLRWLVILWERTTGEEPTISDGTGFLYIAGICWKAAARHLREHCAALSPSRRPVNLHFRKLDLGPEGLRNDLRDILKNWDEN